MKKLTLKSTFTVSFLSFSLLTFAQNWRVGGNTNAQLGGNPPIIGTTQNNPLNFITNSAQRMFIQNGTGTTAGFIGIGNNFNTPLNLLHLNDFPTNIGLLFRTDGNSTVDNKWQFFTGTTNANVTEKGIFYTSPNSTNGGYVVPGNINTPNNHFNIQATQGDIIFRSLGNIERGLHCSSTANTAQDALFSCDSPSHLDSFFASYFLNLIDDGAIQDVGYKTSTDALDLVRAGDTAG